MPVTTDDVCFFIRRLYFVERLTFEQIAEQIGFSLATIRRAVVIDGGLRTVPQPGPYNAKESDS